MSSRGRLLIGAVGVLVLLWILWTVIQSFWLEPVGELQQKLDRLKGTVDQYQDDLDGFDEVQNAVDEYVARTLGGSLEEVDHRFRSRLNRIGESVGLQDLSVGTGRSVALLSPGRNDFKGRTRRALREEVDFVELEGSMSGFTNWKGVLELLDRLKSAAWIKKIDNVRLRASGDGSRLQIAVQLRTIFIPGRSPEVLPDADWSGDRLASLSDLVARSPFMIPVPPPVAKPAPRPAPPVKKPAPGWRLTGVAGIDGEAEVWISNIQTGRSKRLRVGQRHAGLVLEGIQGDFAAFRAGDSLVSIQVGQMLDDTTPVHK
ncbi:MAG: hypothetical protein CMJ29_05955 [Phycisphaerae bacterium]|nr:hypothetical protein [Phycisphaerae bacterium]